MKKLKIDFCLSAKFHGIKNIVKSRVPSVMLLILFLVGTVSVASAQSLRKERRMISSGNALYNEGKYAESAAKYREALKINPQSDVARFNLGMSDIRMSEKNKSNDTVSKKLLNDGVNCLTEVARLGNKKPSLSSLANYNLGNLSFNNNDYAGAIGFYKQALRLNPNFNEARRNLRIAQLKQQNQNKNNDDNKDKDKDKEKDRDKDKQQEQNPQQNQQDKQDPQEQQPKENEMSEQAASRILNAVENNESQLRQRKGNNTGNKASGKNSSMRKW